MRGRQSTVACVPIIATRSLAMTSFSLVGTYLARYPPFWFQTKMITYKYLILPNTFQVDIPNVKVYVQTLNF